MNWIKDWWIKSFFLCCLASTSSPEQVTQLDLGQLDWTLTSSSGTRNISVKGHVPGGVYTDLQTAGIIGDLYFRFNSVEYSWIGETDWIYSADLVVDDGIISKESIELECQGLDTVSSIWLNNERVGTSNNMFVRYIYPIKELLKPGLNRLEFRFKSGVVYAQEEYDRQAKEYIVPPSCVPKQYQGVCHANHIRKMQASFSWDWGPSAPSVGIWKPLHLVAFDNIRFKYVMWDVEEVNELLLSVNLRVIFQPGTMEKVKAEIGYEIRDVFEREVVLVELVKTQDNEMEWSTSIQIPKADVSLWWPNGRGEQILYDVLLDIGVEADTGDIQLMDKVFYEKGLGFRTVELVQDPMEIEGNSFYFKINGEPVFMKGSNWIPGHVLPEKVSKEYIYDLLYSAKEANMNMLRVWGGGIYELEEFYQTADQLGILIWQDMMFACSMYPADQASLFNIRSEIKHQVRRISRHPSIALWAGNNENEAALRGNWYGTDTNFSVYKEDYIRLYVDTVQTEILKEDRSRPFLLSSPSNGNINQQEGFISQNPYNPLYGDVHVYNYRDNNWDPEIYGVPRFCSEYGFQSFPSFELVQSVSQAEDWSFSSDWFKTRQHHPGGNLELSWQINLNLFIDLESLDTETGLQEFLYLAQLYQAVSLKTESEHYRRHRSQINIKGEGMTMGALYWQLNDIWPGASWTSLEYGGKWKMSHYYAVNFFSPTLISPVLQGDFINIHVVCDEMNSKEHVLHIRVYKWNGFAPSYSVDLELGQVCSVEGSSVVASVPLRELLENGDCRSGSLDAYRLSYCMFVFELVEPEGGFISENYIMESPRGLVGVEGDFSSGIQKPTVWISLVYIDNQVHDEPYKESYTIQVNTDNIALYIWIEAIGIQGRFSQNGFHMVSPQKYITFYAKEYTDLEILKQSLQVRAYNPF